MHLKKMKLFTFRPLLCNEYLKYLTRRINGLPVYTTVCEILTTTISASIVMNSRIFIQRLVLKNMCSFNVAKVQCHFQLSFLSSAWLLKGYLNQWAFSLIWSSWRKFSIELIQLELSLAMTEVLYSHDFWA